MPKRSSSARGGGKSRPRPPRARVSGGRGREVAAKSKGAAAKKRSVPASGGQEIRQSWATLRLGLFTGATVGRWVDTWRERYPGKEIELIWLPPAKAGAALESGEVDIALSRLPLIVGSGDAREELFSTSAGGFNIIPLYEEKPVVICSRDSFLAAADELQLADLAGETLLRSAEDPVRFEAPGTLSPKFADLETLADAVATVAAGVGFMLVPMSVARLFERKDLRYVPVADLPATPAALCWLTDSPAVSAFMGVVRGRSANSSRA